MSTFLYDWSENNLWNQLFFGVPRLLWTALCSYKSQAPSMEPTYSFPPCPFSPLSLTFFAISGPFFYFNGMVCWPYWFYANLSHHGIIYQCNTSMSRSNLCGPIRYDLSHPVFCWYGSLLSSGAGFCFIIIIYLFIIYFYGGWLVGMPEMVLLR